MSRAILNYRVRRRVCRWRIGLAVAVGIAFCLLNLKFSAPYFGDVKANQIQGPQQNIGWPLPWYTKYPNGYIHPWELLPYEAAPRAGVFHLLWMTLDAAAISAAVLLILLVPLKRAENR